eukprot:gene20007-21968_t
MEPVTKLLHASASQNRCEEVNAKLGPLMTADSKSLPPEVEEGNIEYKFKLLNPTATRIEHLVTQMKWRLREGAGEAIYEIGVEDNGTMTGLTHDELECSLKTIRSLAERLEAETTIVRKHEIKDGVDAKFAAEVLVRKIPEDQEFVDIRVAVIGNVDVGKSTLLGVLTHAERDNGRGRARLNLFRHLHEIQSGRTSSISHEILGFDSNGEVLMYNDSLTAEDICAASAKLITFIDLAGHHKYMKTTVFGLTGCFPGAVMLVVGANTGMAGTTREHLGLAIALRIPLVVVITKTDLSSSEMLDRTMMQLERILKSPGCNKVPIRVEDMDDVATSASNFPSGQVTPIFRVSCVNGQNLDLLKKFLFLVPPTNSSIEQEKLLQQPAEFQVDEIFHVVTSGTVVSGTLSQGVLKEGDRVVVGPSETGDFIPVSITSIHRNRTPARVIRAGQAASVAISNIERSELRRGMVLLEPMLAPYCCMEFEADVFLLFHTTAISKRFQATVHIGNVIQTAVVIALSKDPLRTGQRAKIRFRFLRNPEYLKVGSRILFRERRTKGIGEITQVYYFRKGTSTSDHYQGHSSREEIMKPAHIFRDQVNVVIGWFSNWNDIEQTIACYFLLKRLAPTQARFLSLVLDQTFKDSANDILVLEQEANNQAFLKGLYHENKDFVVQSLLMHLPLLHPGNDDAKAEYLTLLPNILSHSLENSIHEEECKQLFSLARVHPAFTQLEKNNFNYWLGHLTEKTEKSKDKHPQLGSYPTLSDPHGQFLKTQDSWRPTINYSLRGQSNGWRQPAQQAQTRHQLKHKDSGISTSFDELGSPGSTSSPGELGQHEAMDDFAMPKTRVTRSSSFPVDPKILHRKVSPQHSLDSDDELVNKKAGSPDEVTTAHPGMKDVPQWLKTLRLHKYSNIFSDLTYEEMMDLTEEYLEKKDVTKGARNKILVCIQKLKERHHNLINLESEMQKQGKLSYVLSELRQIVTTPIRPYLPSPPISQSETCSSQAPASKSNSVGVIGDPVDPDDLPSQIIRVMGKASTQVLVVQPDEECCHNYLWILEKVLAHEAYSSTQKRKLLSWKVHCQKLAKQFAANRSKVATTERNMRNWMIDPLGSNSCIGGRRRGPRGGSLKGTSSSGMIIGRAGPVANLHKRLGPSQSTYNNIPVKPHQTICRTKSAPIRPSQTALQQHEIALQEDGMNKSFENLETLCRSMTEHALEEKSVQIRFLPVLHIFHMKLILTEADTELLVHFAELFHT